MDLSRRLIDDALTLGASYAGLMYHEVDSSIITAENGALKSYVTGKVAGLGVRVIVDGALGLAASTTLDRKTLQRQVEYVVKMTKAARNRVANTCLADTKTITASWASNQTHSPNSMSDKDKMALTVDANKSAMLDGITNSITRLGWLRDHRTFKSSEGTDITCAVTMAGLAQTSISRYLGTMEYVSNSSSRCAGFEFIREMDWCRFSREVSETALNAVKARAPKAGVYEIVADPDLIGLILHEAFGHALEADLVTTEESVLEGRLGKQIASPLVTIIDDGMIEGGYLLPYDDEGVAKSRQGVIENGTLKTFLHSRETAHQMRTKSTGNARSERFDNKPTVRQTNLFMEAGNQSFEELIEDVEDGLYVCGRGARGGEVDVGLGTFTFRAGPSYRIKHGEVGEMIRSVSISGTTLETLQDVDAVGKDVQIRTSIFGGCGKDGQTVRVGHGGPHVRIGGVAVGGRC